MENASKALLMATGVLIGIVLLSLISYLYISFSNSTKNVQNDIELAQRESFNNKFLIYDRANNLTLYDIQTAVNLVKENNDYYGLTDADDNNYYITVDIDGLRNIEKNDFKITLEKLNSTDYMQTYQDPTIASTNKTASRLTKYTGTVLINPNTGIVNYIKFTKNLEQND